MLRWPMSLTLDEDSSALLGKGDIPKHVGMHRGAIEKDQGAPSPDRVVNPSGLPDPVAAALERLLDDDWSLAETIHAHGTVNWPTLIPPESVFPTLQEEPLLTWTLRYVRNIPARLHLMLKSDAVDRTRSPKAALPRITDLDDRELANCVTSGLPAGVLSQVAEAGYTLTEVIQLVYGGELPREGRLTPAEGDCAVRLIRIADRARKVFGDPEKASRWLRKPKKAFGGKTCIDMLMTEQGGREVENMLVRIEHGMAA